MQVRLTNGYKTVTVKIGFSFTVLFFGFIALGIRKQWPMAILQALCGIIYPALSVASALIMAFFANERRIRLLLTQGYTPVSDSDRNIIRSSYGFEPLEAQAPLLF